MQDACVVRVEGLAERRERGGCEHILDSAVERRALGEGSLGPLLVDLAAGPVVNLNDRSAVICVVDLGHDAAALRLPEA